MPSTYTVRADLVIRTLQPHGAVRNAVHAAIEPVELVVKVVEDGVRVPDLQDGVPLGQESVLNFSGHPQRFQSLFVIVQGELLDHALLHT